MSSSRRQKHPATYQCTLCPKRFTRASNLRSHLRTHTDERPFVCSVCGKAFTRQNDRKSHEALHTGEKKFVCRGALKHGGTWGCGRRFARASNLGRHFRSDSGRICIRHLLEEEAVERVNDNRDRLNNQTRPQPILPWNANPPEIRIHPAPPPRPLSVGPPEVSRTPQYHSQNRNHATSDSTFSHSPYHGRQPAFTTHSGAPSSGTAGLPINRYRLPAALLAQYPALSGIVWDSLPQNGSDQGENTTDGRSSFDAGDSGSSSHNQATKSSDTLSAEEKVHLLEKILKSKGFDVTAELNLELRGR